MWKCRTICSFTFPFSFYIGSDFLINKAALARHLGSLSRLAGTMQFQFLFLHVEPHVQFSQVQTSQVQFGFPQFFSILIGVLWLFKVVMILRFKLNYKSR
jgi:hypothetical protein